MGELLNMFLKELPKILTTILAFGIFFWVAKKLFWASILQVIENRQARIQGEFDKVTSLRKEVEDLKADYSRRIAEIEREAQSRKQQEIAQGRKVAEEMIEQARAEARAEIERVKQAVAIEMDKARVQLREEVVAMTVAATERIIRERLDDAKHRQLISQFVEELAVR
jgi:F-type H+-transporting ATPase subunit b